MTLEKLYSRRRFGMKPGLDMQKCLMRLMGNPHERLKSIHVAGTNGKGSVCAMIEAILRSHGYSTGLYTSPHLVRFNERIRINGREIPDNAIENVLADLEPLIETAEREVGIPATFFEVTTAIAFKIMADAELDVAILETGLGGRLDSTNVVVPKISVITGISLEHTESLGPDIESVAREKAGIIKPGKPMVCGDMADEAIREIRRIADEKKSEIITASNSIGLDSQPVWPDGWNVVIRTAGSSFGPLRFPMPGRFQIRNLAVALTTVNLFLRQDGTDFDETRLAAGLKDINWAGRCQVVGLDPLFVVDGAHNAGAAAVLAETMHDAFRNGLWSLVLGMCADKDIEGFLEPFQGIVNRIFAVPIANPRSADVKVLTSVARGLGFEVEAGDLKNCLARALALARNENGCVCVAGSLFLAGEVLGMIDISARVAETGAGSPDCY